MSGYRLEWKSETAAKLTEFQAQVECAEVKGVGERTGQRDAGVGDLDLGLQGKRLGRVLQGQQATDLAGAVEFLAVVLAFDLEAERIVLRL